jgi:hypothetical protein
MFLPERSTQQIEKRSWFSRVTEILQRKKENDFIRFSPDGTRKIHIWRDKDCEVSRAGMFSVQPFYTGDTYDERIFEIARSGSEDNYRFSINIESVATDSSKDVIKFSHYGERGILQISGGTFVHVDEDPSESRTKDIQRGHMLTSLMPHRINFDETAKRFFLNAVSEHPSFDPPELVPYDALLDSKPGDKVFSMPNFPQLK